MRILAIISGDYGTRHVENIRKFGPPSWTINTWQAPAAFPLIIDYPEDYIPQELPETDLVLSFAEHRGVAELLPDIAKMTNAKAVVASIDNESWLPRGLARQLRGWLADIGVACATPKPLCSLTENDFGVTRRQRIKFESPYIAEFATYFGQPSLIIQVDPQSRIIQKAEVRRDAVCGCARYVAERLVGISADDASEKAGLLHHHYPCLASMGKDSDFGDTLMHVSGNVLKDNVEVQVRPYKRIQYISPGTRSE
ncbi:MAG TPA: DUF166 family protein [Anaerolineales bacterium]